MSEPKRLSELEITSKIRTGDKFWVGTNSERTNVLRCAKFLDKKITTKAENGGYMIYFL
jgi:hypothetical protein